MSFSGQIKEELEKMNVSARHCQLAELAALYEFCHKETNENKTQIVLFSENDLALQKCFTLLKKTFNIYKDLSWSDFLSDKDGQSVRLCIEDEEIAEQIRSAVTSKAVTTKSCCRRAYIRGAFLAIGSISDPNKSYHLEFVCPDERRATKIQDMLATFSVDSRIIQRKKYYVLYVKDGTQIVDILNIMGAHLAMMEFENTRILKEVRNSINRKCNCETANIGKTVSASTKQVEDIKLIMNATEVYKSLPQNLKDMAQLRLSYPEATLKELGELADPPLGKSGVNHRLRKLSEVAETVKEEYYD